MNTDTKQKIIDKLEELVEILDEAQKEEVKDHESLQTIKDWLVDSLLHMKESA